MIEIKKIEWFKTHDEDSEFIEQVVYTFNDVATWLVLGFKDDEKDSFEILLKCLIEKTANNRKISYEIIKDGDVKFIIRDGKRSNYGS